MTRQEALTDLNKGMWYLQNELGLRIFYGGRTALRYDFNLSYGVLYPRQEVVFYDDPVPQWFKDHNWAKTLDYDYPKFKVYYFSNNFLPKNIAYIEFPTEHYDIWMSSHERGLLETIYLIDGYEDPFDVCCHMDIASELNPDLLQLLLENCTNNRVKRWFLYLSEKYGHPYYKKLDLSRIELGTEFIKDGSNMKEYVKKYNMDVQIDVFRRYNDDLLKEETELMAQAHKQIYG